MDLQIFIDVLIGFAVVALVLYRQLVWRPVNMRKMMMTPAVLAIVGLIQLKSLPAGHATFTALDGVFIAVEVVAAVGIGLAMGLVTKFKTDAGVTSTRGGKLGAGLWVAFIVVRLGLDVLAHASGAAIATSVGIILLTVAANRFTQSMIVLSRYNSHRADQAQRPLAGIR